MITLSGSYSFDWLMGSQIKIRFSVFVNKTGAGLNNTRGNSKVR